MTKEFSCSSLAQGHSLCCLYISWGLSRYPKPFIALPQLIFVYMFQSQSMFNQRSRTNRRYISDLVQRIVLYNHGAIPKFVGSAGWNSQNRLTLLSTGGISSSLRQASALFLRKVFHTDWFRPTQIIWDDLPHLNSMIMNYKNSHKIVSQQHLDSCLTEKLGTVA